MPVKLIPNEGTITILEGIHRCLLEVIEGLTPAQLHTSPEPDAWSINDVLAHLRSRTDIWGSYIEAIVAEDNPTFRAVNPRTWIASTDYPGQEFRSSLNAFLDQGTQLLKLLESLAIEVWSRKATVMGAGKPLVRTVHFCGQWLARHERTNLK